MVVIAWDRAHDRRRIGDTAGISRHSRFRWETFGLSQGDRTKFEKVLTKSISYVIVA